MCCCTELTSHSIPLHFSSLFYPPLMKQSSFLCVWVCSYCIMGEEGRERGCGDGIGMLVMKEEEKKKKKKKMSNIHHDSSSSSWILSTLSDLEERMKALAVNPEGDEGGDAFAQRAESYYRTRPQLLSLLQDMYKSFVYLSERYTQVISKQNLNRHHSRRSSLVSAVTDDCSCPSDKEDDGCISNVEFSDAESSLSYQHPKGTNRMWLSNDGIVAELIIKNVEQDIILHELELAEHQGNNSSRKISLQRSLLEVLESERMILVHENGKLGYRVSALVDENHNLASESIHVKKVAGELARCMIEDQRVSILSRRIEDLQGQVRGLEKRNEEYYEQLTGSKHRKDDGEVRTLGDCLRLGKAKDGGGKRSHNYNWRERVKRMMDIFPCGMQTDIS